MNSFWSHVSGIGVICVLAAGVIASGSPPKKTYVYETGSFSFPQRDEEVFTKPALGRILKASKNVSIVLRVPAPGRSVTAERRRQNNEVYNTIEKEFAKAGFVVRDRALFAKVLDQEVPDYTKIKQITETDFILELLSFKTVPYVTNRYVDSSGISKVSKRRVQFTGSTVEFRLISVKENDLVGSYTFNYTPCTTPCSHRFTQGRRGTLKIASGVPRDFFKTSAQRLIAELRR